MRKGHQTLIEDLIPRHHVNPHPRRHPLPQQFQASGGAEIGLTPQHDDGIGWLRIVDPENSRRLAGERDQKKQQYNDLTQFHLSACY
jgi:hypothetical protein